MNLLRRSLWLPGLVLLSGAILTGFAVAWQVRENEAAARLRFEPIGQRTADEIANHMRRAEYGLRGLRGAAIVVGPANFNPGHFERYAGTRNLTREFPGALSLGYIRRVAQADEAALVAEMKRAGRIGFRIETLGADAGERYVIVDVALAGGGESQAIGIDIASDPTRRAAAVAAMRSGEATLTGPITLTRSSSRPGGSYLMLLPVYRPGAPVATDQQRESATIAWTYMALAIEEVLADIDRPEDDIAVVIRDVSGSERSTVFASVDATPSITRIPVMTTTIPLFGRLWEAEVRAGRGFVAGLEQRQPRAVAGVGLALALIAASMTYFRRRRVERDRATFAAQARAAAIVESSTDAVIGESLDGIVTDWNDGAARLFGYSSATAVGCMASDLLLPNGRESEDVAIRAAIRGGERVASFDTSRMTSEGVLIEVSITASPIREADGRCIGFSKTVRDISEARRAQRSLAATEGLLRRVGRLAGVGGWLLDLRDDKLHWSEQTRRIHEVPDDFVPTLEGAIAFYESDARAVISDAVHRGRGEGEGWDLELPFRTFTGRPTWVHAIGEAEFEDGKPVRLVGALQDITARRKADDLLRETTIKAEAANRAKSLFLANMSHEIRTPMNAVIGLSFLMERTPLNAEQADTMAKIKLASKALLAIIDDVLDLSKIEASEMTIEQAPFSLRNLLTDLTTFVSLQTEAKGIGFGIDVVGDLPPYVRGDVMRLRQVLANLLGNAVKFTERGGVRLAVRTVGAPGDMPRFRFAVHDSGIGIAPDALESLFLPFVQADTTTTRRFGGTGLGLSIVKQLVTLMGGELGASSVPGVGSEFWVELDFPLCDTTGFESRLDLDRALPGQGLRGVRILVADDNLINLEVAVRVLQGEGADVRIAHDGQEAIDSLRATPNDFDVILMDIQMPVLDGLNATRRIRDDPLLARLPIVALTAGSLTSEYEDAEAAGISAFLSKPLDPMRLVHCIRRLVHVDDAAPVETASTPAGPDWPRVDGIDADDVSRRFRGDVDLFRSMLAQMFDGYADLCTEPVVDAAGLPSLGMRLHSLAGSAGTLGAKALMRTAVEAEAACRDGDVARADSLARDMTDGLRRLRGAAAGIVANGNVRATAGECSLPPAVHAEDLAELLRLLRDLNLGAVDRFAAMAPQLRDRLGERRYASLHRQIDRLAFADATATLQAMDS